MRNQSKCSVVVLAEEQMPVIPAEQEPEPAQIRAQLRHVVALAAHEPSQRLAIRAAEPVSNKAEQLNVKRRRWPPAPSPAATSPVSTRSARN